MAFTNAVLESGELVSIVEIDGWRKSHIKQKLLIVLAESSEGKRRLLYTHITLGIAYVQPPPMTT
jgi:hypothetical protein